LYIIKFWQRTGLSKPHSSKKKKWQRSGLKYKLTSGSCLASSGLATAPPVEQRNYETIFVLKEGLY
jgi:hypothetical protein